MTDLTLEQRIIRTDVSMLSGDRYSFWQAIGEGFNLVVLWELYGDESRDCEECKWKRNCGLHRDYEEVVVCRVFERGCQE